MYKVRLLAQTIRQLTRDKSAITALSAASDESLLQMRHNAKSLHVDKRLELHASTWRVYSQEETSCADSPAQSALLISSTETQRPTCSSLLPQLRALQSSNPLIQVQTPRFDGVRINKRFESFSGQAFATSYYRQYNKVQMLSAFDSSSSTKRVVERTLYENLHYQQSSYPLTALRLLNYYSTQNPNRFTWLWLMLSFMGLIFGTTAPQIVEAAEPNDAETQDTTAIKSVTENTEPFVDKFMLDYWRAHWDVPLPSLAAVLQEAAKICALETIPTDQESIESIKKTIVALTTYQRFDEALQIISILPNPSGPPNFNMLLFPCCWALIGQWKFQVAIDMWHRHRLALKVGSDMSRVMDGYKYIIEENYNDALPIFDSALTLNPNSINLIYAKALILEKLKLWDVLLATANEWLKINKKDIVLKSHKIKALMALNEYEQALLEINDDLRENESFSLYRDQGICLMQLTRHDEAFESFQKSIDLSKAFIKECLMELIVAGYSKEEAMIIFNNLSDAREIPRWSLQHGALWALKAGYYKNLGQFHNAKIALDHAIKYISNDSHLFCQRSDMLLKTGLPLDALLDIQEAERLEPTNNEIHFIKAVIFFELGKYHDALAAINTAINLTDENKVKLLQVLYQIKSMLLIYMKYEDKAMEAIDFSIKLDVTDMVGYIIKAQILLATNQPQDSFSVIQTGLNIDGNDPGLSFLHCIALASLGKEEDALNHLEKISASFLDESMLTMTRLLILFMSKNFEGTLVYLQSFTSPSDDLKNILNIIKIITLLLLERHDEAMSMMQLITSISTRDPGISLMLLELGRSLRLSAEKDEKYLSNFYQASLLILAKAVEINPDLLDAYNELAILLSELGYPQQAESLWHLALAKDDKYKAALWNLTVLHDKVSIDKLEQHEVLQTLEEAMSPSELRQIKDFSELRNAFMLSQQRRTEQYLSIGSAMNSLEIRGNDNVAILEAEQLLTSIQYKDTMDAYLKRMRQYLESESDPQILRDYAIDFEINQLLGIDVNNYYSDQDLIKYLAHVEDWDGKITPDFIAHWLSPIGIKGNGVRLGGWLAENFLILRFRCLFSILVDKYGTIRDKETVHHVKKVLDESYLVLVALKIIHDLKKLDKRSDIETYANKLAAHLNEGCPVLVIKTGHKGHALYVTFEIDEERIKIRIDNLGDGHNKHPKPSGRQLIYPCQFHPWPLDSDEKQVELIHYLADLLEASKAKEYEASSVFKRIYANDCLSVAEMDEESKAGLTQPQTVKNCTVKNFNVGAKIRLGENRFTLLANYERQQVHSLRDRTRNLPYIMPPIDFGTAVISSFMPKKPSRLMEDIPMTSMSTSLS